MISTATCSAATAPWSCAMIAKAKSIAVPAPRNRWPRRLTRVTPPSVIGPAVSHVRRSNWVAHLGGKSENQSHAEESMLVTFLRPTRFALGPEFHFPESIPVPLFCLGLLEDISGNADQPYRILSQLQVRDTFLPLLPFRPDPGLFRTARLDDPPTRGDPASRGNNDQVPSTRLGVIRGFKGIDDALRNNRRVGKRFGLNINSREPGAPSHHATCTFGFQELHSCPLDQFIKRIVCEGISHLGNRLTADFPHD